MSKLLLENSLAALARDLKKAGFPVTASVVRNDGMAGLQYALDTLETTHIVTQSSARALISRIKEIKMIAEKEGA